MLSSIIVESCIHWNRQKPTWQKFLTTHANHAILWHNPWNSEIDLYILLIVKKISKTTIMWWGTWYINRRLKICGFEVWHCHALSIYSWCLDATYIFTTPHGGKNRLSRLYCHYFFLHLNGLFKGKTIAFLRYCLFCVNVNNEISFTHS